MLSFIKMVAKSDAKIGLVSFVPSGQRNRGPFCFPRTRRYFTTASTGHILLLVLERKMEAPCLKGSVLDCLICIVGEQRLSKVRSARERWQTWSKLCWDGTVNSLTRRKPKKATQQAVHSIVDWYVVGCLVRRFLICCNISVVIGRRILDDLDLADSFQIPFRRCLTLGVNWESKVW